MAVSVPANAKLEALRKQGALNTRPERVKDPLFRENEFFDPNDLVQVKYEMLRRVRCEGSSVVDAASAFGFSRVAFYQARERFQQAGPAGLLPQRKGPRRASKLSGEVMVFVERTLTQEASLRAPALAERIKEHFGIAVHPRSIERALARREKKRRR